MQPIQINVSVNIGVTDGLLALLTPMFNRPQVEAPAAAPAPRTQRASKQQPVVENPEPQPGTEAKTEAPEPEVAASAETAPVEATQENKTCTVADVRAAMDRTRKRIEGENWKENPDSEGYKKWHRTLTGWFKNTAAICGAEKPSMLPDGECCEMFIKCCERVKVVNDELVEDCPF